MGDRSNVNFVFEQRDNGEAIGLNVYSHSGGTQAQLDALECADTTALTLDSSYFVRCVARRITKGDDGENGSGFTPFVVPGLMSAYRLEEDSDGHLILSFDFISKQIVLVDESGYRPKYKMFDMTHEGIKEARNILKKELDK